MVVSKAWCITFQRERVIKELQEKYQQSQQLHQSELEALRSKVTAERHEREKEQNDHGIMIRWAALISNREHQLTVSIWNSDALIS